MRAFILAGGFATRLWPLTEKRAKPLLPLAGKPIIDHMLEQIPPEMSVAVSTNAALQTGFREWIALQKRPNLSLVVEETRHDGQKLGALGAIAQWLEAEQVREDILLLTGDNYFGFSLQAFLQSYSSGTPLLAAYDIGDAERAKAFGTVLLHEGSRRIRAFEEKPAQPQTTFVSTGCSILPTETHPILLQFAREHSDNVGGIFEELLRKNWDIDCYTFTEQWFDIGSFPSYLEATRALVGEQMLAGADVVTQRCTLEGSIVLGDHCFVENSTLKNTVVFRDCTIADCVLEDCVIDSDSTLRGVDLTGKMIRQGTVLERK
ncbi:MAG: NDP-sugar synthase [Candidatus Peribacteraceae bacterium]|nr:NDP-sugar synthase [Candidatus Peribacteraceae bacterium]